MNTPSVMSISKECCCSHCRPLCKTDNVMATDSLTYLVTVSKENTLCINVDEIREKLEQLSCEERGSFGFVSVVGGRNSGKTALMNQIMGIVNPYPEPFPTGVQPDAPEGVLIRYDPSVTYQGRTTNKPVQWYWLDIISAGINPTAYEKLINFCIRISSCLIIISGDPMIENFIKNHLNQVFHRQMFGKLPLKRKITLVDKDLINLKDGTPVLQSCMEWSRSIGSPCGLWSQALEDSAKCLEPFYSNVTIVSPLKNHPSDALKSFDFILPLVGSASSETSGASSVEELLQTFLMNIAAVNGDSKEVATETDAMYHGLYDSDVIEIYETVTEVFKTILTCELDQRDRTPLGYMSKVELDLLLSTVYKSALGKLKPLLSSYGESTVVVKYILDKKLAETRYYYMKSVHDIQQKIQTNTTLYSAVTRHLHDFCLLVVNGYALPVAISRLPKFENVISDAVEKIAGSYCLDESLREKISNVPKDFLELFNILHSLKSQLDDSLSSKVCVPEEEVKRFEDLLSSLIDSSGFSETQDSKIRQEFQNILQALSTSMLSSFGNENNVRIMLETVIVEHAKDKCLEEYKAFMEAALRESYFSADKFAKFQKGMMSNVVSSFIPEDDKFRISFLWEREVGALNAAMKELFVGYAQRNARKCYKYEQNRDQSVSEAVRTFTYYMDSNPGGNIQAKIFDAKHAAYLRFEEITETGGNENTYEVRLWRTDLDAELARLEVSDEYWRDRFQANSSNSMNLSTESDASKIFSSGLTSGGENDGIVGRTGHYLRLVPRPSVAKESHPGYDASPNLARELQSTPRTDSQRTGDAAHISDLKMKLIAVASALGAKVDAADNLTEIKRSYVTGRLEDARTLLEASTAAPSKLESMIKILEMVSGKYF